MSENMQEKIAKLLAKAEGTDNPHEAEAFSQMAERLMLKWGIEEAQVRAAMGAEVQAEQIVVERLEFKGRYAAAHVILVNSMAGGLGNLRVVRHNYRGSQDKGCSIIGHESDVKRALMLATSLQLQVVTALRVWWKGYEIKDWMTEQEKFKARRQFIISFGVAVGSRLARMRAEEVAEAEAATTGTELVLLDRKAAVDGFMDEKYGKLRSSRSIQGSRYGAAEGHAAGQRANLGGTSLAGTRLALG